MTYDMIIERAIQALTLLAVVAPVAIALYNYAAAKGREVDLAEDDKRQKDLKEAIWSAVRLALTMRGASTDQRLNAILSYVNSSVPEAVAYQEEKLKTGLEKGPLNKLPKTVQQVIKEQATGILMEELKRAKE